MSSLYERLYEALQQVSWEQFSHAYGSATDTPSYLLDLISDEVEEREAALSQLWASICHQGSVYDASAIAAPFLIQILQEVPDEQKPEILGLLCGLAVRHWYAHREDVILKMDHSRGKNRHEWWSTGRFLQTGNEYHQPQWMERSHQVVGEGLPIYLALLHSAHQDTVREALNLLACFQELSSSIIAVVVKLFSDSHEVAVRVAALYCLSTLLDAQSSHWEIYYQLVNADPLDIDAGVRLAAASILARQHAVEIPSVVVDILVERMLHPLIDAEYKEHSLVKRPYYLLDCRSLSCLGVPSGLQGLIRVLEQGASRWSILDTIRVAEAVLDVAFFGCWVENRYWNYHSTDSLLSQRDSMDVDLRESNTGNTRIGEEIPHFDDDRAYFQLRYSRSSGGTPEFLIHIIGYDKKEARNLRQLYEQEGLQALQDYQIEALQAVLRCGPLWEFKHNLLEIYGLPTSQKEVVQLLLK